MIYLCILILGKFICESSILVSYLVKQKEYGSLNMAIFFRNSKENSFENSVEYIYMRAIWKVTSISVN
jgi:hypothetical protein